MYPVTTLKYVGTFWKETRPSKKLTPTITHTRIVAILCNIQDHISFPCFTALQITDLLQHTEFIFALEAKPTSF